MKRDEGINLPPHKRKMCCFRLSQSERELFHAFEMIMKYGDIQACIDFVDSKIDTVDTELYRKYAYVGARF